MADFEEETLRMRRLYTNISCCYGTNVSACININDVPILDSELLFAQTAPASIAGIV
jgi:hypothetical protein